MAMVLWVWDYAKDEETEMTREDMMASEKAKWESLREQLISENKTDGG